MFLCSSTPKWESNQANRRDDMFNEQVGIPSGELT